MGKRKFNYMMVNPLTEPTRLQHEYDFCEHLLCSSDIKNMRDILVNMRDLEKMSRKVVLKKITPSECWHMRASLKYVQEVFGMVESDDKTSAYIFDKVSNNINAFFEIHEGWLATQTPVFMQTFYLSFDRYIDNILFIFDCWAFYLYKLIKKYLKLHLVRSFCDRL